MNRRTGWIIGIATAIITVIGLNAALGSRYRMQHRCYDHSCLRDKKEGANKQSPVNGTVSDSTNGR